MTCFFDNHLNISLIMHREAISKISIECRKKTTVGIFGKSGEGKSTLLSAILGKEDLLPCGSAGACTAVVSQVEANLSDSNYTAEIELISKEVSLFSIVSVFILVFLLLRLLQLCLFAGE